ncbi:MAG: 4-vinyl reductase [Candidatus Thermoplasmatota archaeon]
MRYLSISQKELIAIRGLYESVMSHATYGLFLREGEIIGKEISEEAIKDRANFFENCKNILIERCWLENVNFFENAVEVKGSIEVSNSNKVTCHRLRGIFRAIYEIYFGKKVYCREVECESMGSERCIFKIDFLEGK